MGTVHQILPPKMWCAGCGADSTVAASAADPGPCPCGSQMRISWDPRRPENGGLNSGPSGITFVSGPDAA